MYYVFCLILILTAVGMAYYGMKYFGFSLATSFAVPLLALPCMLEWYSITYWIIICSFAAIIFFFSTPLTYLTAWFWVLCSCILSVCIVFAMLGLDSNNETVKYALKICAYIILVASIVITVIIRRHLKAVIIGISSGFCLGLGASGLISGALIHSIQAGFASSSSVVFDAITLPFILIFVATIGGILFQYLYMMKKFPNLFDPTGKLRGEHRERII
jgi:hypothetical protein